MHVRDIATISLPLGQALIKLFSGPAVLIKQSLSFVIRPCSKIYTVYWYSFRIDTQVTYLAWNYAAGIILSLLHCNKVEMQSAQFHRYTLIEQSVILQLLKFTILINQSQTMLCCSCQVQLVVLDWFIAVVNVQFQALYLGSFN